MSRELRRIRARCATLLRRERGSALPIALGVMLAVGISTAAAIEFATLNEGQSNRQSDDARAFSLAEAGLANGVSQLTGATDPLDPAAVGTGSSQAEGGTAEYSGSLSGSTWTITGTGTVASPIAGAAPIERSVSLQMTVSTTDSPWDYLFSDSQTGCMQISNNAIVAAPIYARGNVCIDNNAHVTGSPVQVEGTVSIGNNGSIGYPSAPIESAALVGGCTAGGSSSAHPCSNADRIYALSLLQTSSNFTKPSVDLAGWYANAKPGPSHNCTLGSVPGGFDNDATFNGSRPTFQLTSGAAYDCQYWQDGRLVGRLAWSPATDTLTVAGVIFFDGTVRLSGDVVYQGRATIYSSNQVLTSNNTSLCGVAGCTSAWNPRVNLIVFVAGSEADHYGFELDNNTVFQGGAYVVNDYRAHNNAETWGPVIARQIYIANNADHAMSVGALPPGAPGIDTTIHPVPGTWRG